MTAPIELHTIGDRADEPLVDALHRGLYLDAFADQAEPVAAWKQALWSPDAPYELTIRIARAGTAIVGGIVYERYRASGCGLVTYMVVAPAARGSGLGKRLLDGAVAELATRGAPIVFGEVNDPRRVGAGNAREPVAASWQRLERNQRWGARVVDVHYVQPALGAGLARDRGLCLIALAAANRDAVAGAVVRAFVAELFACTERRAADAELRALLDAIPARVALVELRREPQPRP